MVAQCEKLPNVEPIMDTVSELAPARRSNTIQSVDRAATLLKAVADARRPPTVIELAEACGLNRSTAWRLLATLERHGLVERDAVTQRYGVGYALLAIAAAADQDSLTRRARPALERLALETRETVGLAVAKRLHLVYVDQLEAPQIMAVNWLGKVVPLHATSAGKAFLAFLDEEEREALLDGDLERFTASTVTDRRTLEQQFDAIRRDRHCVCVGELEDALFGVSAAVLGARGRPVAVVSVWGSEHRVPRSRLAELAQRTRLAADEIEVLLR
jgi:DNA-binding IclR family transcriptional regulator